MTPGLRYQKFCLHIPNQQHLGASSIFVNHVQSCSVREIESLSLLSVQWRV